MNYYYLMHAPLVHLLQVEAGEMETPQNRLAAREALYARLGELSGGGWYNLGTAARAAMMQFFDSGAREEVKADMAITAAKKLDRRVA